MKIINKIIYWLDIIFRKTLGKSKRTLVESKCITAGDVKIYATDLGDIRSVVMDVGGDDIMNITASRDTTGKFPCVEMLVSILIVPYSIGLTHDTYSYPYALKKIYNAVIALLTLGFRPDGDGGLILDDEEDDKIIEAVFRGNISTSDDDDEIYLMLYMGDEDENMYKLKVSENTNKIVMMYFIKNMKEQLLNVYLNDQIRYLVKNNLN